MSYRLSCFVIMPYSEDSDRVYSQAISPALSHLEGYNILTLRADEIGRRAITLKAHVENAVRTSDFCIADLTSANPNVMYELGFAGALGKPFVLIAEKGKQQVPANLRGFPIIEYRLDYLASLREQLTMRCNELAKSIVGRMSIQQDSQLESSVGITVSDAAQIVNRYLESTETKFSAMVFSSSSLVRKSIPQLRSAASRGVLIRIVCADPEGELTRINAVDSGVDVARLRSQMWNDLRELHASMREVPPGRVEIRITNSQISIVTYLFDDTALIFPYLMKSMTSSPGFAFSKDSQLYSTFKHEFDRGWSRAQLLSIEGARL